MTAAEKKTVAVEDRRLWARMRIALLATLIMCGALFAAGYMTFGFVVSAHRDSTDAVARLERIRLLADRLADEARALGVARGPVHGMIAREAISTTLAEYAAAVSGLLRNAGTMIDAPSLDVLHRPPHRLAASLAEAHELANAAMGDMRDDPRASRRAGSRLERLVGRRIDRGIDALIAVRKSEVARLSRTVETSAKTVAVLALLLFVVVWRLSLRPLLSTVERRTGALIAAKADVERALLFDGLTGLPNRRNLLGRLDAMDPAGPLGVLHVDLAGLNAINTTLGWEVGEKLIRYTADTLGEVVTGSDLIARVDTDGFVVAIPRQTGPEQLQELAVEIIEALGRPVALQGHSVSIEAVIGIAARETTGEPAAKLLSNADIARSRAREEGGSVYFSTAMRERLAARRQTAQELLRAIVGGEIEPHFQPQIDTATGALTGVEALVRWRHPERGLLYPHFFLDIAETAHIGRRISDIVVRRSVEALAAWRKAGVPVPRVGINFTAQMLRDPELGDRLIFDLDRVGLGPGDMAVEILESALIRNDDDPVLATVEGLTARGFHVDLDDFGTGHAALAYLRHQTVSRLKIDRSFVRELHLRPRIRKMTEAMIRLAHTLEVEALAEGVETEAEWRLLRELGCDGLQGFAIAKPMPAAALPAWYADYERRRGSGRIVAA